MGYRSKGQLPDLLRVELWTLQTCFIPNFRARKYINNSNSNILYLNTIGLFLKLRACGFVCKSNHIESNASFLTRGENRSTWGKTSQSRAENQQTQPTYDPEVGNRTWATLVGGECSHHCATTAHSWNYMYTAKETRIHGVTGSPLLLRCITSYEYLFKYFSGGVVMA